MEIKEIAPQKAVVIRAEVRMEGIAGAIDTILPELGGYLGSHGMAPSGPPFTRYISVENGDMVIESGMPVTAEVEGNGRVTPIELPGGSVVETWHIGSYATLGETYAAMERWIADQGLASAGPTWEVYWTNPVETPNVSDWKTQVVWPVGNAKF
jgi:effector-binding domain-containing protein